MQGVVGPLGLSGREGPWGDLGENGARGPKGEKGHIGLMVSTVFVCLVFCHIYTAHSKPPKYLDLRTHSVGLGVMLLQYY